MRYAPCHAWRAAMLIATLRAAPAMAQGSSYSFVTTLGKDTLSLERYRRSGDSIVGDWVSLYGGIMYHHYEMQLRPDGSVSHYRLALHRVSGQPNGNIDIQFAGDTAIVSNGAGDEVEVVHPGAFPFFAGSVGPLDLMVSRARAMHRDSVSIPSLGAFGPYRRDATPIVFFAHDSVRLGSPPRVLVGSISADGLLTGLSARATTTKTETRRVASYDLAATLRHFPNVADSVRIAGVPAISPRDTVHASIGSAAITIDYGRPAVRGRAVFNNGVLGDTLWRTGANAATQLTTTTDLVVGRDTLRAGAFSVWMRVAPDNSTYALVFNSQTGQWGTEHHSDRDVLTVPLERESLKGSVERFTIRLPSAPSQSTLRLEWGTTVLSVPVRSR